MLCEASPGQPLRVVLISQEEPFTLPPLADRVAALEGVEVVTIVAVHHADSPTRRGRLELGRGFGFSQTGRMAARLASQRLLDTLDRITGDRLPIRKRSLRAVARRAGVAYRRVARVDRAAFLDAMRALHLDLIVSLSAPVRFPPALLATARLGGINLHCSLLPARAGLLPSFWTLYHGDSRGGATVHRMVEAIDRGPILGQIEVAIAPTTTIFELVHRTKAAGGELLLGVLAEIRDGRARERPHPPGGDYCRWPNREEIREFRRRGGRLI